ncbi:hypothetical protein A6A04_03705 [Paramagnetospirillum marisnigri]|uniref:Uncharacterized protein n=1 Tax=Paramagnetospirillum marisnigri TaxID=1285242 RepID=A0A178MKM1_9PROT|nr:hypothetical protein [Paramagnetospirillum marisnigri]OAN49230.1 hypothetical protein A6A04_03705 [Paramagnetospirillum marisnigri]
MRYIAAVLGFLAIALGLVFAATWWVDPYGYFGRMPLGLYDVTLARHVKARMISIQRPEGVLMGSSTMMGVFPNRISGCRLYNAAFPGARPSELAYMAEAFLPPMELAVIGLDFFAFNASTESDFLHPSFGTMTLAKTAAYALSFDAIRQTRYTIKTWRKQRPAFYADDGSAPAALAFWEEYQAGQHSAELTEAGLDGVVRLLFGNWRYSVTQVVALEHLRDVLAARGVKAVVYINPMGPTLTARLEALGLVKDFQQFRADIRRIFPESIDYSDRITEPERFYPADPMHFPPDTGTLMVRQSLEHAGLCRR